MTYAEKLVNPLWQKKRLEILSRDNFTCRLCKDTKRQLDVHHGKYNGEPWSLPNDLYYTLCHDCHEAISKLKIVTPISAFKIVNDNNSKLFLFKLTNSSYIFYNSTYLGTYTIFELGESDIESFKKLFNSI